jgi:preprotein translocase subunit Sec63
MNYYEELGIRADAESEEIRKAHRRLVKLMHPDRQPDPQMKHIAETQIRRLNTIVSTLLSPDQRGEYDKALSAPQESQPTLVKAWSDVPWWLVGVIIAGILSIAGVWLFVLHLDNSPAKPVNITPHETSSISRPSYVPAKSRH